MDKYHLYKSLYDRELNRRKDLDAAINLPMTLLSIIVAANSYLVKESNWAECSCQIIMHKTIFFLTIIGFGISIFYLTRSYNNLFKGFAYRNFGLTAKIRKYESELNGYNEQVNETDRIKFEDIIIDKLTGLTDNHIIFNDKRSRDLYLAKTFLIICIMLTIINFMIFSLNFINI